jgi:hypothetical protein
MRSGAPRTRVGSAVLALVLAAHVLLVWLLSQVIAPYRPAAAPPRRVELRLIAPITLPADADAPRPPDRIATRNATVRAITRPRTVPRDERAAGNETTGAVIRAEATAPSPPSPSSSPPSLIDAQATRRAIRASARMPSLVGEAARVTEEPRRTSAQEQLGNAVRDAGKGDCDKGEFAGAGMGLLSLPFLAAAAVRGDCAR